MDLRYFLNQHGIHYQIERNGNIISTLTGLKNQESHTSKAFIGFLPNSDIQKDDCLINPSGDRFVVVSTETDYFKKQPFQLKAYYLTDTEYQKSFSTVFNISNAYGSVIGTQANVALNYNDSLDTARKLISESDSSDKEELQQIISLLEMVINNQVPAQKGLLSRFSDVMERNSWITGSISGALLSWLMSQI